MSRLVQLIITSAIVFVLITARDTVLSYVPVVMLGYDVVAYHFNVTGCDSILGNKKYSHQLVSADGDGIDRLYEFWFVDENNLNIFKSDPWRYAPRFGGFCSYGTCCELAPHWPWTASFQGPAAGPDKSNCAFRIHTDGYLYFNDRKTYDHLFFENAELNIRDAKNRWIEWFGSLESGPFNHYCFSTAGHSTISECVDYAQRYAPAVNKHEERYPVDNDFYDDWFNQFNELDNTTDVGSTEIESTEIEGVMCTAICRKCSDGSCQPRDENCKWLSCPSEDKSYFVFGIIALAVVFVAVFIVVFICYRQKNKSIKENFEQLANEENDIDTNDIERNQGNEHETDGQDTIHDDLVQSDTIIPR